MSGPAKTMISVAEALSLVEARLPAPGRERVPLAEATGRVLAEEIRAGSDLPHFASSARDGYALRAADVAGAGPDSPVELPLAGEIAAGYSDSLAWPSGSCLRILTGAQVPPDCDGVVPVEDTEEFQRDGATWVRLRAGLAGAESHLRPAGEDLTAGDRPLGPGHLIGPPEMALLAAMGHGELTVTRRLRAAYLVTGDELLDVGDSPGRGQIRDCNGPLLASLLAGAGVEALDLGRASDDEADLRRRLSRGLAEADLLVSSGGISMGRYDLVGKVLADLGAEWVFHKVAEKPGKPLAFFLAEGKPVFALPGNPVSTFMTFWYYVGPALAKMMGRSDAHPRQVRARLTGPLAGSAKRQFFGRAMTRWVGDHYEARPLPPQGSHILSSLAGANSFVILAPGTLEAKEGEEVTAAFFR